MTTFQPRSTEPERLPDPAAAAVSKLAGTDASPADEPRAAALKDEVRSAYLDELVARGRAAADAFREFDQEAVDRIVWALTRAGLVHAAELARIAVEETGIGNIEDKVLKNYVATEFLYDYLKDKPTVGVIREDPVAKVKYVAEPIGLVLAVLPITNPTATVLFKAIVAMKTRNAILFRASSRAHECTRRTVEILVEAGREAGLPDGAIQMINQPTRADTMRLFRHPSIDFIWTTGGQKIVQAANASGKPNIGVGAGNATVYIHESADIRMAVSDVVLSKTFDASVICPAEQTAVVDASIKDAVLAEFARMGAHTLGTDESAKLMGVCFDPESGEPNMLAIGRSVRQLAKMAKIDVPEHAQMLVAPVERFDRSNMLLHEKLFPVLALLTADSTDEGIGLCEQVLDISGIGHTSAIFATDRDAIDAFARRVRTGRVLVNEPTAVGAIGGVYNDLPPTFSLGCGTWGGTNTTDNVNYGQLLNIKHVSERKTPPLWFRVTSEVFFNDGAIENLRQFEAQRVVVVTSPGGAWRGIVDTVRMHLAPGTMVEAFAEVGPEPDDRLVAEGAQFLARVQPDLIVAVGGGSVLDAAKLMRVGWLHPDLDWRDLALPFLDVRKRIAKWPGGSAACPLVAVPTTSGTGSEVSPVAVVTDSRTGAKATVIDYSLVPESAIVDPQLARTQPVRLLADSGIDALTHAVEALVSVFASSYTDALAIQAIRLILTNLPVAVSESSNMEARRELHNAATIAGMAFANASVGAAHALAHAIGSALDIPHGRACGIALPHVIAYNAQLPRKFTTAPNYTTYVAPERYAAAAQFLGIGSAREGTPADALDAFYAAICRVLDAADVPDGLAAAGVSERQFEDALPKMVELAFADVSGRSNPRRLMLREIEQLLRATYAGHGVLAVPGATSMLAGMDWTDFTSR